MKVRAIVHERKPRIRLAVRLSVIPLVLLFAVWLFSTLRQGPEITKLGEVRSADGLRVARFVFAIYPGHLTGDPAEFEVYVGHSLQPDDEQSLVFASDSEDCKVEWVGPRELRILMSSAVRPTVRLQRVGDVTLAYEVGGW